MGMLVARHRRMQLLGQSKSLTFTAQNATVTEVAPGLERNEGKKGIGRL